MTSEAEFQYRIAGRRAATLFALAFGTCFLAFAVANDAPWWLYPPILLAFGLAGYAVLLNPQSGITITNGKLTVFSGSWSRSADLADIINVEIVDWTEGPPSATATLKDGTSFGIPSMCLPERAVFIDVLRQHGVPLA